MVLIEQNVDGRSAGSAEIHGKHPDGSMLLGIVKGDLQVATMATMLDRLSLLGPFHHEQTSNQLIRLESKLWIQCRAQV